MYEIKYRKPEAMKDTRIDSIGYIPYNWKVSKAQYYFQIFAGGTPSTNEPSYWGGNIPWINSGKIQNNIIDSESKFITKKGLLNSSTKLIDKNTTLMAMTGATCGNVGYLTIKSAANQSVIAFTNPINFYSKYLFYYFMTQKNQVNFFKIGGAQGGINVDNGKKLKVIIPNLSEQQKIANFLDIKTARFDSIISKKEKLIEKLEEAKKSLISEVVTGKVKIVDGQLVKRKPEEMKDSGVEWFGLIPKNWSMMKFSHIISITNGQVDPRRKPYMDMILIAPNHIEPNTRRIIDLQTAKKQGAVSGKYLCHKGDVIYSKIRPNLCKVCIAPLDCLCSADMYPMKTRTSNMLQEYLFWILLSNNFTKYVVLESDRVAMPKVNRDSLFKLRLPVPSIEEQRKINNYLINKDKEINLIITKIKKQIQKLKEAKQALISEAVTGKIDLKDWEIIEQGE